MKLKLYDGAWLELAGYGPQQAWLVDGLFEVNGFTYLANGTPIKGRAAPDILLVYSRGCYRQAS
jgi:hypothetical protein